MFNRQQGLRHRVAVEGFDQVMQVIKSVVVAVLVDHRIGAGGHGTHVDIQFVIHQPAVEQQSPVLFLATFGIDVGHHLHDLVIGHLGMYLLPTGIGHVGDQLEVLARGAHLDQAHGVGGNNNRILTDMLV